jgi:hypothetical protein
VLAPVAMVGAACSVRALEATADSNRPFDAVVVGEYERAFYGSQFESVLAPLRQRSVRFWLPEAGGVVDLDSPVHRALLLMLGAESRREVVRARHRTLAAMRAQTCLQGRFPGWPSAIRLPAGGRRTAPEPRTRELGPPGTPVGSRTRLLRRGCGGSSSNAQKAAAWPASPEN